MTLARRNLSRIGPLYLPRSSHGDVVASPPRRPRRRGAAPLANPPKHGVDAAFVVAEARTRQTRPSFPAVLRHLPPLQSP